MSETQAEILTRVTNALHALEEADAASHEGIVKEPLYTRHGNNLFVGFTQDRRRPFLFLRSTTKVANATKLPKNRDWFDVCVENLGGDTRYECGLQLSLSDPDYLDMFELVVSYVVKAVVGLERSFRADPFKREADEFNRSLKKWCRENPEKENPLGSKRQRGLHAELWFLRRHVLTPVGSQLAIKYWVGPLGADHDFQFPHFGVEVKATGASDEDPEIQISNEYQLDPVRRDREGRQPQMSVHSLYLFCLSLRDLDDTLAAKEVQTNEGESETLFSLVESLREPLSGAWTSFRTRLARAGYRMKHEKEYDVVARQVVRSERPRLYEVADKVEKERFPRIIRSHDPDNKQQLPSAIRKVKYHLRLADLRPFACAASSEEAGFIEALFSREESFDAPSLPTSETMKTKTKEKK